MNEYSRQCRRQTCVRLLRNLVPLHINEAPALLWGELQDSRNQNIRCVHLHHIRHCKLRGFHLGIRRFYHPSRSGT